MTSNRQGILVSYIIGAPVGLLTVLLISILPSAISEEGLGTLLLYGIYGKATIGLILSFLIALGIGGHNASKDISRKKSLITTSFKYSLTINTIIWSVFIVLTIFENGIEEIGVFLIPPIIAFVFCTIITTFTFGILISYTIRKRIKN